jgi:type I restriction enzyme S subunit
MSALLPPGWTWVPVGDLVARPSDLTDGPFGSNLKTEHYRDSGPRVIRLQNIGNGRFIEDEAHISTEHFARLHKHDATHGDVVVAMLGSDLPRACLVPPSLGPAIVKADCVRLRPDDRVIDARYAVAALNSPAVRRQAEQLVHGVGRPRLGLKWFRNLRVPLAPPAEQLRLVDAIDSYLSRLDAAVASLEAAQRILYEFRVCLIF